MLKLAIALAFLVSPLSVAAQAVRGHAGAGDGAPADWPPNPVFDLAIDLDDVPPTDHTLTLTWSAPTDTPGMLMIAVPAAAYDLRYSTDGPIDETTWVDAVPCPEAFGMVPQEPEKLETLTVTLPTAGQTYWFSIKSQDALTGQWSDVSDPSPKGTTTGTEPSPSPSPSPSPEVGSDGEVAGGGNDPKCGGSAGTPASVLSIGVFLVAFALRR